MGIDLRDSYRILDPICIYMGMTFLPCGEACPFRLGVISKFSGVVFPSRMTFSVTLSPSFVSRIVEMTFDTCFCAPTTPESFAMETIFPLIPTMTSP